MEELTQYSLYEVNEFFRIHIDTTEHHHAYLSHIRKVAYALKSFAEFMRKKRIAWYEFEDDLFEEYKKFELNNVLSRGSSRSESTAQDTINIKLKVIYNFYWWAQEEQLLISDYISWTNAAIRSKIVAFKNSSENFKKDKSANRKIYPALYRRTGTRSNGHRGHYATEEEVKAVKEYFRDTCDYLTAERNILIVDLIEHIGWRQRSVWSLTVNQFSEELIGKALEQGLTEFEVTPPHQKQNYQDSYEIKLQLAIRINDYIKRDCKLVCVSAYH